MARDEPDPCLFSFKGYHYKPHKGINLSFAFPSEKEKKEIQLLSNHHQPTYACALSCRSTKLKCLLQNQEEQGFELTYLICHTYLLNF